MFKIALCSRKEIIRLVKGTEKRKEREKGRWGGGEKGEKKGRELKESRNIKGM